MAIPGASLSRTIRISDSMEELLRNTKKSKNGTATAKDGVLTVYSPGIDQYCYCFMPIYAPRGTVIEVKFEARQDTATSQGRIMLDQYPNRESVIGGLVDFKEIDDTNWRPYTFSRSGDHRNPYAIVTFGFNTASVGRVHFRNIVINVYNVHSPSPEVKMCMLRYETEQKKWFIDDEPGRHPCVGVENIQTNKDWDYIRVNYSRPQAWGMPITFAQIMQNSGRTNFHTSVFSSMDHARIYIVRSSTGEIIMPTQGIQDSFLIGVLGVSL